MTWQLPALAVMCLAAVLATVLARLRHRSRLLAVTESVTRNYARVLLVKQKQLVIHDGYGNYQLEGWIQHANYFIDSVILREAKAAGLQVADAAPGGRLRPAVTTRFLEILRNHAEAGNAPADAGEIMSGTHYETLCHNILEHQGWVVTATPLTGDQGADLIADSGGRRVVIQCKFYSKPVGNKAVQEAFAARAFHGADHAAVVSNNSFTRSAQQLARANGVLLLHHDELPDLADRLASG